jgi:hypothetical protein
VSPARPEEVDKSRRVDRVCRALNQVNGSSVLSDLFWLLAGLHGDRIVAEKLHKLASLRRLSGKMSELEKQRRERIERGENAAEADRDAAQLALTELVAFFLDHANESEPLVRLLGALAALAAGSSPSPMLAPTTTSHRRPDPPAIEGIKGRLAAIMEFRQRAGLTRKQAAAWVARHLSAKMKDQLGSVTPATVDSWLLKWGGERGVTHGIGHEGYLHMRNVLKDRSPSESDLEKIFEVLSQSLPS